MAKIIIHEVKMNGEEWKQTGRRLYVDKRAPLHNLEGWNNALGNGYMIAQPHLFDAAVVRVDNQDKAQSKKDFEEELQSIAQEA